MKRAALKMNHGTYCDAISYSAPNASPTKRYSRQAGSGRVSVCLRYNWRHGQVDERETGEFDNGQMRADWQVDVDEIADNLSH